MAQPAARHPGHAHRSSPHHPVQEKSSTCAAALLGKKHTRTVFMRALEHRAGSGCPAPEA